jgi:hypothetical protein
MLYYSNLMDRDDFQNLGLGDLDPKKTTPTATTTKPELKR